MFQEFGKQDSDLSEPVEDRILSQAARLEERKKWAGCQVVCILLEGPNSLKTIYESMVNMMPCIVAADSGNQLTDPMLDGPFEQKPVYGPNA